ncbi:MAG: phosphonopyruvate decarboxylase, partial [Gammaproteobacteria bacterium]|nr:phosphonopyruvate decarboxylase [Gammaproteobacteria bacterium]
VTESLARAMEWFAREQRPYAFVMQRDAVAPHALHEESVTPRRAEPPAEAGFTLKTAARSARDSILRRIVELSSTENSVLIATTGYTGRELFALADRPNHLYMVGSMGCASSLGLGLSLARPDLRIVVIDGDGAALMRMGNLATVGTYGGSNLIHIILDNEAHDSTGAQATVSMNVNFAAIAAACGYGRVARGDDPELLDYLLDGDSPVAGPSLGQLKIRAGTLDNLPRPTIRPPEALRRLMRHIGSRF